MSVALCTSLVLVLSLLLLSAPTPALSGVSRSSPLRAARPSSAAAAAVEPVVGVSFPRLLQSSNTTGNYSYCALCESVSGYIAPFVRDGTTAAVIEKLAIAYCVAQEYGKDCHSPSECVDLCTGIIGEFGPVLLDILANTSLSAQALCFDLALCPAPVPLVPGVPVASNVSDMSGQKAWAMWAQTSGTGTFVHLSDLHYDALYAVGSSTECGLDLCCRAAWSVPGNTSGVAGVYGDYMCDAPAVLVESLLDFLNTTLTPRPDFILYTGDDPAHDVWHQNRSSNLAAIAWVSATLLRYFPDIPVLSAIGNHEAAPVNQFGGPGVDSWLYEALVLDWAYYLPHDAQQTLNYGGYYAALVRPGLYVLSINSNIYSSDDFYTKYDMTDLSNQLLWLNDTLHQIEQLTNARAIIIAHQSPQSWIEQFADQFNVLLSRYQRVVLNTFFGHTHHNQVQLYADDTSKAPHTVGYVGGSITPYTNVNPGVAVYSYDRALPASSGHLVSDVAYYWLNLTQANEQRSADWVAGLQVASVRRSYGLASLAPADWWALTESWLAGGGSADVFELMQRAWYKGVYSDGSGSVARRQCFACSLETDTDTQMAACAARAGVNCGSSAQRQQQQQQAADRCGAYSAEHIEAQRQKAAALEQLKHALEQRTAGRHTASRARELEHRHVRRAML